MNGVGSDFGTGVSSDVGSGVTAEAPLALHGAATDARADEIILLDDLSEAPIGSASKAIVHGTDTPLHLAFSCHVFDREGRLLITRRALTKRTWPGVWTNSFCGHPRPGESVTDALHRHAEHELGIAVVEVESALPGFRYRATDASGVVENEVCPVFTAVTDDAPAPSPHEVVEFAWAAPGDVARAVAAAPWAFSPWLVLQASELPFLQGVTLR